MTARPAMLSLAARSHLSEWAAQQRVLIALVLLILFGALRYDHFLGAFNVLSVLRYNSMFALTGLGMCFVIMTGGHRSFGRHDGGAGERRLGDAVAVRTAARIARRPRRGAGGRRHQRPDGDPARNPPLHRHAVGHAHRQRNGAAAGAQPVRLGVLRHRLHLARPGRFPGIPGARLDRAARLCLRFGHSQPHQLRPRRSWRSAATRRRRG